MLLAGGASQYLQLLWVPRQRVVLPLETAAIGRHILLRWCNEGEVRCRANAQRAVRSEALQEAWLRPQRRPNVAAEYTCIRRIHKTRACTRLGRGDRGWTGMRAGELACRRLGDSAGGLVVVVLLLLPSASVLSRRPSPPGSKHRDL